MEYVPAATLNDFPRNRCAIAEIRQNRQKPHELQELNSIPGEESISFVRTRSLGAIGSGASDGRSQQYCDQRMVCLINIRLIEKRDNGG
jgi:hypothetical protein